MREIEGLREKLKEMDAVKKDVAEMKVLLKTLRVRVYKLRAGEKDMMDRLDRLDEDIENVQDTL